MQTPIHALPPELAAWRTRLAALAQQAAADNGDDGAHDANHLERVSLRWVPRHKNQAADALSQRALAPCSDSISDSDTETDAQDAAQAAAHERA